MVWRRWGKQGAEKGGNERGEKEESRSRWALFLKTHIIFHLGLIETEKHEYHPSYATLLNQLWPPCRRITRNIFRQVIIQRVTYGRITGNFLKVKGGRFSVLVGSVGELKVNSKKLWVLNLWMWVQGLKFLGQGLKFMGQRKCLETNSKPADHAGIPLYKP